MRRTRVLLADDHLILAEGLANLLKNHFTLVGIASNGYELMASARQYRPDVIIADISMPLLSGIEALKMIKKEGIPSKFIILTMHADSTLAAESLNAGAAGYILKQSACTELVEAVMEVTAGRTYISSLIEGDIQSMLFKSGSDSSESTSPLTLRQREILHLTAEGRTMREIGAFLKISPRTVESHKYSLMQTLGLRTTAELVQYAVRTCRI